MLEERLRGIDLPGSKLIGALLQRLMPAKTDFSEASVRMRHDFDRVDHTYRYPGLRKVIQQRVEAFAIWTIREPCICWMTVTLA